MGEGADRVIARRFRLERQLGSGGFGSVWLAADLSTTPARKVAIKLLHQRLRAKAQISERFAREIHVLSELDHPNIARAIAWGTDQDPAFLAMEHVQGVPLDRLMVEIASRGQFFSKLQLEHLFGELCSAVGYAHSKNVVHRDLKPQNVMVAPSGDRLTVKVLDFGIARLLEESPTDRTTVGRMIGSPYYLAPEQIDSSGVDERSDIFSLGSILFELLTLKRCWVRDDSGAPCSVTDVSAAKAAQNSRVHAVERIARGPRPRPSEACPGLSPIMDEPVLRAINIDPLHRYPNTEKLFQALKEALERAAVGGRVDHSTTLVDTPLEAIEPAVLTTVMPVGFDLDTEGPVTQPEGGRPMVEPMPLDTGITPVVINPRTNPPLLIEERVDQKTRDRTRFELRARRARRIKMLQGALVAGAIIMGLAVWRVHGAREAPAIRARLDAPEATPETLEAQPLPAVRPLPAKTSTATAAAEDESPKPAAAAKPAPAKTAPIAPAKPAPAKTKAPPVEEPVSEQDRLLAMLERARANPEDRQLTFQVADRLSAEAASLPEPVRGRLQRCVTRSNMAGNIDQVIDILYGCVRLSRTP